MSQYASKSKTLESEAESEPEPAPPANGFSAVRGLLAPVQTTHLCESIAFSATPWAARRALASRRRRSSWSVKALPAPPPGAVILGSSTDWKEDEEHEVDGIQRKVKRYRMIDELYAATEKVVPVSGGGGKKE
ncbi:hypothetical protein D1007_43012 [Hordeum vulgare]|nr:hypothetical protein D1007_43012 [Hordeum vulgare]